MEKLFSSVDSGWRAILSQGLELLSAEERDYLISGDYLPGSDKLFAAFSQPLAKTRYILFGESPYPRVESATGYAFMDGAVGQLWSDSGLSKPANRATSLRNFIKMLLIARGDLVSGSTGKRDIARLQAEHYVQSIQQLQDNMHQAGFLMLNATPVLRPGAPKSQVNRDAKTWLPFMNYLLEEVARQRPDIQLLLWGGIADKIEKMPAAEKLDKIKSEHPYNVSFIENKKMQDFFRPMNLLKA